ncbi:MAG: UDP-N-acetylmuramoyl-L-alanine--D-glutamate ligase [Acidobacteria bacterium]|nr:UDP-N-acetylmuramoyl-L-alanine--D-glutamate ligase [Acidobacteriota bacterium]
MKLRDLERKSILILGFGTEGQATYEFLRGQWPSKPLSIADRRALEDFPEETARRLQSDPAATLHFGPAYLDSLLSSKCEVIVKTPGIPASTDRIAQARRAGLVLTSHSQIFMSNYPREKIAGITGTKGKSTTASLLYGILKTAGIPAELVGNIGQPPLARFGAAHADSYFVHEFSSHQLAEIQSSPHIAVLLNVFPEHLDYYSTFEEYAAAKENITRFQEPGDFLVFNAGQSIPNQIAQRTRAALRPFSTTRQVSPGCHIRGDWIVWSDAQGQHDLLPLRDVRLPGRFNIQNVMAAAAAATLCGAQPEAIREAVRNFKSLPHRLELLGTYNGVTFVDDSIATVPEATLAALEALGPAVQTLILGGHERNLDFTELGSHLPPGVRTVILFPATGPRIWKAIEQHSKNTPVPEPFFVSTMEEAVKTAYARTEPGKTCLLSPASPSFGIFKDYRERGESFKAFVRTLSNS